MAVVAERGRAAVGQRSAVRAQCGDRMAARGLPHGQTGSAAGRHGSRAETFVDDAAPMGLPVRHAGHWSPFWSAYEDKAAWTRPEPITEQRCVTASPHTAGLGQSARCGQGLSHDDY